METALELSKTFPKTSKEAWKEKAMQDLKGADFDRKLVWKTYDGIPIQPFYTPEDTTNEASLNAQHLLLGGISKEWINYVEIPVNGTEEANNTARKMLAYDATGILFDLKESVNVDFSSLLDALPIEKLHISFRSTTPRVDLLKAYFDHCQNQGIALHHLKGFYESDVLERWITKGIEPDFEAFEALVKVSMEAPKFYGIVVGSHAFANSGASSTQETSFLLSKVIEYLTLLTSKGLSANELWSNIFLHTAIGGDFFFELAKLRALRILIKTIAEVYEVVDPPVQILASSGLWSKSLFDPNVNLLRNTTEAMSAVLGGSDALLIRPHDSSYNTPSDFSHRIALNVSNLLKEEAYLDQVVDPAGGSYYLETLTAEITTKALQQFQETENKGGFVKAFESGEITAAIKAVRKQKEQDVANRKQVFVGTNKYPNLLEKTTGQLAHEQEDSLLLQPQRATQAYDNLRLKTLLHFEETGFIPKVYLACFGNLAMRKARATFSLEFFGTAGFEILGEFVFEDAQEAANQSSASTADIVVICSSDQEYEAEAENFTKNFKSKAPDKQLVLAGFPAAIIDALKNAGIDAFIHVKTNAVETLSTFQQQLLKQPKNSPS